MEYKPPFGSADPDAPYVDRNTPGATSGSVPPAPAIEHPQREIVNAIIAAGLTPDEGDLTQLSQAIPLLVGLDVEANQSLTMPGYTKTPGGAILQFGTASITGANTVATLSLPVTYPNGALGAVVTDSGDFCASYGCSHPSASQIRIYTPSKYIEQSSGTIISKNVTLGCYWFSWGW